jgi:REP element-mobilizing transposase RayT
VPRQARSALPGGVFHVATRGVSDDPIFRDDTDRKAFLTLLGSVVARHEWSCHAYCLMTTHYHLIVETERQALSLGMRRLNGGYARSFNERHDRRGHLFGGRYSVYVINSEDHLTASCLYVLENPVRAGLCERASDWPWSDIPVLRSQGLSRKGTVPLTGSHAADV